MSNKPMDSNQNIRNKDLRQKLQLNLAKLNRMPAASYAARNEVNENLQASQNSDYASENLFET